jgi:hypothetical protein
VAIDLCIKVAGICRDLNLLDTLHREDGEDRACEVKGEKRERETEREREREREREKERM